MTETLTADTTPVDEARLVDPQAVADLMAALERVFRIGVYYPAGHVMCDQAAAHFLSALERTLGKAPSLRFALAGGMLHLQDVPLDEELRGVAGFREILTLLGISAVTIDSNITPGELHEFVTRLLAYRNQIKGTHSFQQLMVGEMPLSIAVEHLEFTAREPDEDQDETTGSGDRNNPTLESLLTALARHGLEAEELERCRRLLEAIPAYLKQNSLDGAALPQVSWQDVEKLLVRAAQVTVEPVGDGQGDGRSERAGGNVNLDALTAIFKTLGECADAENPRHAIDLLLSLSRRGAPDQSDGTDAPRPRPQKSDEARDLPVHELRASLAACGERAVGPPDPSGGSRGEELTILMQLLARDLKLPVQVRIQKRIRDVARQGLQPDEWDIAVAGMRDLADPDHEERLFGPLLILTDALRASKEASVLAFLRDISAGCDGPRLALIWPFLVNEILLEGRHRDRAAFDEVCALAASADETTMQGRLPRLESLAALRERRCVRGAFTPPPPELYRVFALILGSAHADFVGERLLDGLRHEPPNWLAEAVVPLLKRYQSKYRRFTMEVLRMRDEDEPDRSLLESAGRIVADNLSAVTIADGHQEWVPRTLRALSALRVPGGEALLRNIVDQRHWIIIHAWPEPCRQAARDTLASWRLRLDRGAADAPPPLPGESP